MLSWFRFITIDPVPLSLKAKAISTLACFAAVLLAGWLTALLTGTPNSPVLVASLGASAVILFFIPNSPLAQPWPLIGGQIISALVGMICALAIPDIVIAGACAAGISVFAMLLLRCLHPPATATALTPVTAGSAVTSLGLSFAVVPVAINVLVLFGLAVVVHRWLLNNVYPVVNKKTDPAQSAKQSTSQALPKISVSESDLRQALAHGDKFLDVSAADLSQLLSTVQLQSYQQTYGLITCGDIMVKDIPTLDYGSEVEEAWQLMHNQRLKAVPVIDKARRVIGIVTWNDFFKFIDLKPQEKLMDKFLAFVRRTPDVATDKPEAVGHIMTHPVQVLADTTHIVELIPLMAEQGFRQIPVVDAEKRLAGMVYPAHLIAALFKQR